MPLDPTDPRPEIVTWLRQRAALLTELRSFFDRRGFLEVQPPCLLSDCVVDAYLDPIRVAVEELGLGDLPAGHFYLQTSPESAMKQWLAQGAPSIYSIGPVFRAGERGRRHRIEFTMLEWYEVGGDMESAVGLLGDLATETLAAPGCDVLDYRMLFREQLGFDPIDAEIDALREAAAVVDRSLAASLGEDRDGLLDVLLGERLAPRLGVGRPAIVRNYPLTQGALAKRSPQDPDCASRFELFADGIEIANGYDELLDAEELVERARRNNQLRRHRGREPLRVETGLVAAMRSGLPPCAGVALGVDRLHMVKHHLSEIGGFTPFSAAGGGAG